MTSSETSRLTSSPTLASAEEIALPSFIRTGVLSGKMRVLARSGVFARGSADFVG